MMNFKTSRGSKRSSQDTIRISIRTEDADQVYMNGGAHNRRPAEGPSSRRAVIVSKKSQDSAPSPEKSDDAALQMLAIGGQISPEDDIGCPAAQVPAANKKLNFSK